MSDIRLLDDLESWVGPILRQRATAEQDWRLSRWQRLWYTLKALICLLARLDEYHGWGDGAERIEIAMGGFARTYSMDWGEGAAWDSFVVGWGVRRGWWFGVLSNGYP